MRTTYVLLVVLILSTVVGFSSIMARVGAVTGSLSTLRGELLPVAMTLSTDNGPLEVSIMNEPTTVTLKKTVDGIEVEFTCTQQDGESSADFGKRCRAEFKEWCKGFENPDG